GVGGHRTYRVSRRPARARRSRPTEGRDTVRGRFSRGLSGVGWCLALTGGDFTRSGRRSWSLALGWWRCEDRPHRDHREPSAQSQELRPTGTGSDRGEPGAGSRRQGAEEWKKWVPHEQPCREDDWTRDWGGSTAPG